MSEQPLYALRTLTNPDGAVACAAGTDRDGQPILLGEYEGAPVAVCFTEGGDVREVRHRPLSPYDGIDPDPDMPALEASEVLQRWRDELGLRDAVILVGPFHLPHTYRIAVFPDPYVPPSALPAGAGPPHHALWWSCEYWLDEAGRLIRAARENPDHAPCEVIVQLRRGGPTSAEEDLATCAYLTRLLAAFCARSGFGRFAGMELGRGVANFIIAHLIGLDWPQVSQAVRTLLDEHGLLGNARLLLRVYNRFLDGTEQIACEVLGPEGFEGEASLDTWGPDGTSAG